MTENAAGTAESTELTPAELTTEQEDVLEAMRDVVDPELGINVVDLRINWVWMPPWGPENITDDGREQLRALGFNI